MRGAGETQIELDQRMLDDRIKSVQKKLSQVRKRRAQGRRARRFNALTAGGAVSEDRLFATLDPTMRQLDVPGVGQVVLADTVGFIRDLPHSLVEAFKATLEEVQDADLLLLIVDGADPASAERQSEVLKVLEDIDAQGVPRLMVYNKSDLVADRLPAENSHWVSAHTGSGLVELTKAIGTALGREALPVKICLTAVQGRLHAWLHSIDAVLDEQSTEQGGWEMQILIDDHGRRRLDQEQVEITARSSSVAPIATKDGGS